MIRSCAKKGHFFESTSRKAWTSAKRSWKSATASGSAPTTSNIWLTVSMADSLMGAAACAKLSFSRFSEVMMVCSSRLRRASGKMGRRMRMRRR